MFVFLCHYQKLINEALHTASCMYNQVMYSCTQLALTLNLTLGAIWLKSRKRLSVTKWDRGGQPVVTLTSCTSRLGLCICSRGVSWFSTWYL